MKSLFYILAFIVLGGILSGCQSVEEEAEQYQEFREKRKAGGPDLMDEAKSALTGKPLPNPETMTEKEKAQYQRRKKAKKAARIYFLHTR